MRTVRSFAQESREEAAYSRQVDHVLQLSYKESLARAVFWGSVRFLLILTLRSAVIYILMYKAATGSRRFHDALENEKLRDVTPMLNINFVDTCLLCLQTGMSGNLIMLTILYSGGSMMSDLTISVGDFTSFLLYTAFVGASVGGQLCFEHQILQIV